MLRNGINKRTGEKVDIKVLKRTHSDSNGDAEINFCQEYEAIKLLSSKNIIKAHDIYIESENIYAIYDAMNGSNIII